MTVAVLLIQLLVAQPAAPVAQSRPLLDVPFMAQTPELCGGAAVSMVMRYWGARDIFPQDFAPLVSQSDGGIFTGVLAQSVSDRGWTALVDPATPNTSRDRVRAEIARGRPVIALIQVAPRTYHYVVIAAATDVEVVFHDPARGPFRVMDWMRFNLAWSGANYWMMVVVPPAGFVAAAPNAPVDSSLSSSKPSAPATPSTTSAPATPCTALVAHAVQTALGGDAAGAERELYAAMRLCPADAAAWREMAGLRFNQKRWRDADDLATIAVRKSPADSYSWELAATSRYLLGDSIGALAAWNQIGEPKIGVVNIHGAERTPLPVVARVADLEPRSVLTPAMFSLALRRLRDLPVASTVSVKFEPVAGGTANMDIAVVEKSAWPSGRAELLMLAARLAFQREVRLDVAGLAGAGESASLSWRFADRREKLAIGLAFPPGRLPGVTSFAARWEDQVYGSLADKGELIHEARRRAGLQFSDWVTSWLKWNAGAAFDRFNDAGHFAVDASLAARSTGDRAALIVSAGAWAPLATNSDGRRFSTAGVRIAVRSTSDGARPMLIAATEFQRAGASAPLAVWPSAGGGTGTERASTLRGHRLVDDGIVSGDVLGRQLWSGSIEYAHPIAGTRGINVSLAAFVDAAKASSRLGGLAPTDLLVDAGAGLRLRFPGNLGGLRLDVGRALGGGKTVISAGWIKSWPQ